MDDFFSWLKGEDAKTYTFNRIIDANTPENLTQEELKAETCYFRIDLKSMHIPQARKWLKSYHPVAYIFIKVPHLTQGMVDFNVVTSPGDSVELDYHIPAQDLYR